MDSRPTTKPSFRHYFSALEHILGEMKTCFSERNTVLATAKCVIERNIFGLLTNHDLTETNHGLNKCYSCGICIVAK